MLSFKFTGRSEEKELLDLGSDYYTQQEYEHCMGMLFKVNRIFGFFYSTVRILKQFPKTSSILDVGCGGGLFLIHLHRYFPEMKLLGVDISSQAINIAQAELVKRIDIKQTNNVCFNLQPEARIDNAENSVDIVLSTLVCHHLTDDQLIAFLQETLKCARTAVIINDLHRHPIAQWLYALISPILFRNRLITHDGLISIRRGFIRSDWTKLLKNAGIEKYQIKWCFPFRWRVILWKK